MCLDLGQGVLVKSAKRHGGRSGAHDKELDQHLVKYAQIWTQQIMFHRRRSFRFELLLILPGELSALFCILDRFRRISSWNCKKTPRFSPFPEGRHPQTNIRPGSGLSTDVDCLEGGRAALTRRQRWEPRRHLAHARLSVESGPGCELMLWKTPSPQPLLHAHTTHHRDPRRAVTS